MTNIDKLNLRFFPLTLFQISAKSFPWLVMKSPNNSNQAIVLHNRHMPSFQQKHLVPRFHLQSHIILKWKSSVGSSTITTSTKRLPTSSEPLYYKMGGWLIPSTIAFIVMCLITTKKNVIQSMVTPKVTTHHKNSNDTLANTTSQAPETPAKAQALTNCVSSQQNWPSLGQWTKKKSEKREERKGKSWKIPLIHMASHFIVKNTILNLCQSMRVR